MPVDSRFECTRPTNTQRVHTNVFDAAAQGSIQHIEKIWIGEGNLFECDLFHFSRQYDLSFVCWCWSSAMLLAHTFNVQSCGACSTCRMVYTTHTRIARDMPSAHVVAVHSSKTATPAHNRTFRFHSAMTRRTKIEWTARHKDRQGSEILSRFCVCVCSSHSYIVQPAEMTK